MTPRARLRRPLGGCLLAGIALIPVSASVTPSLADGVDLVMDESGSAVAELGVGFDLGPMEIQAEHKEYLDYLTRFAEELPSDPMARRTTLTAAVLFDVAEGAGLPLMLEGEHQHYASGDQDLDLSLESGLRLPGLLFAARIDMNQEFAANGESSQSWDGRFSLGFDWLGGSHEGSFDYDLVPTYQATEMAFSSFWPLSEGVEAAFDFTHRPLDSLTELEIGVNRRYGPFSLESDFSADNTGAYAIGFSVSMSLAPEPAPSELRLSTLLSSLNNATQQNLVQDSFGILAITEGN